jgi:hypothetical protein
MRKEDDIQRKGGKERAIESVTPLPECKDCPARDILLEELVKVNGELQSLRESGLLEHNKTEASMAEVRGTLSKLQEEDRQQSRRIAKLEGVIGKAKRFFVRLLNLRLSCIFRRFSKDSSARATDAHSGLKVSAQKKVGFDNCWFKLYADVRNAEELDAFFKKLRKCSTTDAFVDCVMSLAKKFPEIRRSDFLRSQGGIEQLSRLSASPDTLLQDLPNLARRVRNNFDK